MGFEAFVKRQVVERDRRFADPAFQRELALEKQKTKDSLNLMATHAFEASVGLLVKAPLMSMWRALQAGIGVKKDPRNPKSPQYRLGDAVLDSVAEFGKAGVGVVKVAGAVLHAAGRSTRLGIRYLIAK